MCPSSNVTDKWVLAFAQDMVKFVHLDGAGGGVLRTHLYYADMFCSTTLPHMSFSIPLN